MNYSSFFAVIIGLSVIFFTHTQGSGVASLLQPSAFLIVIIGTLCATFVNFSPISIKKAFEAAKEVFKPIPDTKMEIIDEIVEIAHYARHQGILALETVVDKIKDQFLKRGIQLTIDIENPQFLYDILRAEIDYQEEEEFINSRIFEAMGGYAPTFGIVGAVLGLVQVMSNIQNPSILASGIAVAFVSTLYGVGAANLLFLPIAGKLKLMLREKILLKEVVLQGLISIKTQENPAVVEEKLIAYLRYNNKSHKIKSYYGAIQE